MDDVPTHREGPSRMNNSIDRRLPAPRALCAALLIVGLHGCSFLQTHHYYAPSARGAVLEHDVVSRCDWIGGYGISGPPNRVVLEGGEVTLGVLASPHRITTWTAGPLIVPILPALPPSLFRNLRVGPGEAVDLTFRILEPRSEEIDLRSVSVRVAGQADADLRIYRAEEVVEKFVPFTSEQPEWELTDGWTLPLTVPTEADEPFEIRIEGLTHRGERVVFPPISFQSSRGWTVCQTF